MVGGQTSQVLSAESLTAFSLTLSPQLILHSLYAALLLNEVVDDLRRLLVFELGLGDATHVKQVLQLWVQIIQLQNKWPVCLQDSINEIEVLARQQKKGDKVNKN